VQNAVSHHHKNIGAGTGGTVEWSMDDAAAVFERVAAHTGDFYRNPTVIGAISYDGTITRNEAMRAAAGVQGHKMHLTIPRFGPQHIQPKFLIVPTHDDALLCPWMEPTTFEGRLAVMKIRIDDLDFPVPANWRMPASKAEQWEHARSPIPIDITAAIMRKSPPPAKVQISVFIDGLMKTDAAGAAAAATAAANTAAGKKATSGVVGKNDVPPAPTKAEQTAMEHVRWSGILVAMLAECAKPEKEILNQIAKNPVVPPASSAGADAGGGLDVSSAKVTVTRKCHTTLQEIKTPARSRFCTHAQCVDVGAVVQLAKRTNLWRCPNCLCAARPHDWYIDQEFQKILAASPPNVEEFFAVGPDPSGKFTYSVRR
jgi:hypothetical protein